MGKVENTIVFSRIRSYFQVYDRFFKNTMVDEPGLSSIKPKPKQKKEKKRLESGYVGLVIV